MSEREEFITWVQSVLRDAEFTVHNGDAGPRRAIWSRNDPVTVLGAWKNASGQQELDELFDHLADSFSDCTSYEFELLEAEVRGDTAFAPEVVRHPDLGRHQTNTCASADASHRRVSSPNGT